MRPVLIMSSERSGSNLLRRMLGAHATVAAPPPPHLWRHLARVVTEIGPLDVDANLDRLIQAACRMTEVEGSHLSWQRHIAPAEVRERLRARNLSGVCGALYEAFAARDGRAIWVCKENLLFDHALSIRTTFPETRVIYLCRDGRDYACSVRNVPTHDQHVFCIAEEWADEQRRCLLVHQDLAPLGASTLLRYEDLIREPEPAVRKLCEFLDLTFQSSMLESHRGDDAAHDASKTEYWKNLAQPVMRDNFGKYRRELSREHIHLFEDVAGAELTVLGYPLENPDVPRRVGGLRRLGYRAINEIQRRIKRRRLYREPGRRERESMLREVHSISADHRRALATTLRYDRDQ